MVPTQIQLRHLHLSVIGGFEYMQELILLSPTNALKSHFSFFLSFIFILFYYLFS